MFEVEHTTDFRNALRRFKDFLYFNIDFYVVADSHKKQQFKQRMEGSDQDVRQRVTFLSYEGLVRVYTKEVERKQAYEEAGIPIG